MAAAKKEAEVPAEAPPKKKSKLMMMIIIAVVLLAGGGGGAYWFLGRHTGEEKAAKVEAKPVFSLLETFTVNLKLEENPQFLQVGLSLKLVDAAAVDALKGSMPEVRNSILLLLSSRKASELLTLEGKNKLSTDVVKAVNKVIAPKATPAVPASDTETSAKAAGEVTADGKAVESAAADAATEPKEAPPPPPPTPKGPVLGVLFTSFIIQ